MAAEGKCRTCGELGMILPSLAAGRTCDLCGGELVPTGRPQPTNNRWDRSRFASPAEQAAVAKHQSKVEAHKAKHKRDYMDGKYEEVNLREAVNQ